MLTGVSAFSCYCFCYLTTELISLSPTHTPCQMMAVGMEHKIYVFSSMTLYCYGTFHVLEFRLSRRKLFDTLCNVPDFRNLLFHMC